MFRRLDEIRGGDFLAGGEDVVDDRVTDDVGGWVETHVTVTRADALPTFLAALTKLAAEGAAEYDEVRTFVGNADAEPASYRKTWDRWLLTCTAPDWLTFEVVCAVLPLLRQGHGEDVVDVAD
jgi:hypothetical protein